MIRRRLIVTAGEHLAYALPAVDPAADTVLSTQQLKAMLRATPLALAGRFQRGLLLVPSVAAMRKPINLALAMRLLCRGPIEVMDLQGRRQNLTAGALLRYGRSHLKAVLRRPSILESVARDCARLEAMPRATSIDLGATPVYLRTDLVFGLRAGGSVGHIAGVLNNLGHFTGKPLFLTSDRIPTVNPDIETHLFRLDDLCWSLSEIPNFAFNARVMEEAPRIVAGRRIGFVYQRYSLGNLAGLDLARRLSVPLVLEFNGSEIWVARHWGNGLRHEDLARKVELCNVRAAELVVVVSAAVRDTLLEVGVAPERILVNPNAVDTEAYRPDIDGSLVRRRFGISDNDIVIGFIGTFGPWHGAEVLAEALGRLHRRGQAGVLRLLLVGDGQTMEQTRSTLQRHGALDRVAFAGVVPQERGPEHLAACDILVSPHVPNPDGTPFFGSPTKLFEYMAMGRAIVASRLDQIGDVLAHDRTAWLVEPGDAESLAQGLLDLAGNRELRRRLAAAARAESVTRHSWREHTRRTVTRLSALMS